MTITTTLDRGPCAGRRHDTLWAYHKHGCRCPQACEARDRRNAAKRVGVSTRTTAPRVGLRQEVTALTQQGRSARQIARILDVNQRTVERHRQAARNTPPPPQPPVALIRVRSGDDLDWRVRAACAGHDPELWTTPTTRDNPLGTSEAVRRARQALRICAACPVALECATDPADPKPLGVIRAGVPYDYQGKAAATCQGCGRRILCRSANIVYCSDKCANAHGATPLVVAADPERPSRAWRSTVEVAA